MHTSLDSSRSFPFLSFAHGSDSFYYEKQLASQVGERQLDHIVIAPIYPGEPTDRNASWQVEVSGENTLWESDVFSVLASHDCLRKAFFHDRGFEKITSVLYTGSVKRSPRGTPVSYLLGASRGATVAALVPAYVSMMSDAFEIAQIPFPLDHQREFSRLILVSGVSSITAGSFRLILRQAALGNLREVEAAHTHLKSLPTLAPDFDAFITKGDQDSLDKLVTTIVMRDLTLMSPFILKGVLNWEDFRNISGKDVPKGGKILILHAEKDRVVGSDQSKLLSGVLEAIKEYIRESFKKGLIARNANASEEQIEIWTKEALTYLPQHALHLFDNPKAEKNTSFHLDAAFWSTTSQNHSPHSLMAEWLK